MIILFLFIVLTKKCMNDLCFCNRENTIDSKEMINLYDDSYKKGYDSRCDYKNDDVDMDKISRNFRYKEMLSTLEDRGVDIWKKLSYIKDYDILNVSISINIQEGGLMNDWEFKM